MTFNKHYIDWNHKRIKKIIEYFGYENFYDKTVLDLGCGHSDIGGALSRLGARVIAVDARQEHINMAKKKYPHITTLCVDLDKQWPFSNQTFDFVLNLGLICHLTNFKNVLRKSCEVGKHIILETEVCDSENPNQVIQVDEPISIYDWAFNGVGNKPSSIYIENIFYELGMNFQRLDHKDLNTNHYIYDWQTSDSNKRNPQYRRFWIANHNTVVSKISNIKPALITAQSEITNSPPLTTLPIRNNNTYTYNKPEIKQKDFKVALCISGYLRNFEQTFDSLQNSLLKHLNPDIFIHTWDSIGAPLRHFDAKSMRVNTHSVLPKIQKLYQPVKIVIEPAIKFNITPLLRSKNIDKRDINGLLSMYYAIQACNNIKKQYEINNNFTYDCVIRTRTDLVFLDKFCIDQNTDMQQIYIPFGFDYEGINDQVAYGGSKLMDVYSSVFSNIENLLNKGEKLNPEKLLKLQLQSNLISVNRCHLKYFIKRAK